MRKAVEDDAPTLARLDLATWTTGTSPAPPPADPGAYRFFDEGTSTQDVLVAEVDGAVVGYVKVRASTPLPSHAHVLQVGGLAVDPHRQGAGVGERLVRAAVQECRERGARKLALHVLGSNDVARRLYSKCGFVVEGVLQGEFLLEGRFVDDILMARHLATPGS